MLPPAGKRQTMLFSATLEPEILRLADRWLSDPVSVEAAPEQVVTDLIDQRFYAVLGSQKIPMLLWLLKNEPYDRMIIFGNWKHRNSELTEELRSYGIECEMLSGDIPQNKRIRILDSFKAGTCRVIVATDVAARGIHVDGISHVVNFDLPEQAEDYVHRIGRTGRAGNKGNAISFVCEFGAFNLPDIEQ
jgi:ATP-dependent RNA helicase RhlB